MNPHFRDHQNKKILLLDLAGLNGLLVGQDFPFTSDMNIKV
jgi:hypothetical protein